MWFNLHWVWFPVHLTFLLGKTLAKIHHGNHFSWEPGTIVDTFSPVSFVVKLESGVQRRCHIDQVQKRVASSETVDVPETDNQSPLDTPPASSNSEIGQEQDSPFEIVSVQDMVTQDQELPDMSVPMHRYPTRVRRPPDRYF